MYIEGLIDKNYFEIIKAWGHESDWVCTTVEEAKKKGYDLLETDDGKLLVRIWIDMDLEKFFPPEDIIQDDPYLLGLMVVSENKELKDFAERKLKET